MKLKPVIKDSIELLIKKPKLIQAAFLMTFGNTVMYIFLIAWLFNSVIETKEGLWINISETFIYLFNTIQDLNIMGVIIGFIFIVLIGYFFIYPVSEATLIYAMQEDWKNISKSFNKGLKKFFPMLEFRSLSTFFGIYATFTVMMRLRAMWVLDSIVIKPIIIIWLLSSLFAIIFRPYFKFYIVLRDVPLFDAMKQSVLLTLGNFRLTLKALFFEFFFLSRFLISVILIVILPLGLMYGAITFGLIEYRGIEILLRSIVWILLLLTVYLNSIFQTFLINFWSRIFEKAEENLA